MSRLKTIRHPYVMQRFFSVLIILLTVFSIGCNRRNADVDINLLIADRLMNTHPDSALRILTGIDTIGLDRKRMAHYVLLLTKAQMKNRLYIENPTIQLAYDYFRNSGDSLEMQSLCHYGEIEYYYNRHLGEGLIALRKAFNMAEEQNCPFYAALSAQGISDIYGTLYRNDEELLWAKISRNKFKEANADKHAAWIDISIINSLISSGALGEASEILQSIDSIEYKTEPYYKHSILKAAADMSIANRDYNTAIYIYNKLYRDGYKFKSLNWCKFSESYFRLGNLKLSKATLDSAKNHIANNQERLYCDYMTSLILDANGDHINASKTAIKWGEDLEKEFDKLMNEDATRLLNEYLVKDSEINKYKAKSMQHHTYVIVLILILSVLLAIFIIYIIYIRLKSKRMETNILWNQMHNLHSDIANLRNKLSAKEVELVKIKEGDFKENIKNIDEQRDVLSELLNDLFESLFPYISSKEMIGKLPKEVRSAANNLRIDDKINKLNECIDFVAKKWMKEFRSDFPNLISLHYQLAKYVYVGFSTESIAFLMNRDSVGSIYNMKNRLKNSMRVSNLEATDKYSSLFSK